MSCKECVDKWQGGANIRECKETPRRLQGVLQILHATQMHAVLHATVPIVLALGCTLCRAGAVLEEVHVQLAQRGLAVAQWHGDARSQKQC